jgi:hypothetical protein
MFEDLLILNMTNLKTVFPMNIMLLSLFCIFKTGLIPTAKKIKSFRRILISFVVSSVVLV